MAASDSEESARVENAEKRIQEIEEELTPQISIPLD